MLREILAWLIAIGCVAFAFEARSQCQETDTIVIVGQSNSGTNLGRDLPKAPLVPNAWIIEPEGDNIWHPLEGGWDTTPTTSGHEVHRLQSAWAWMGDEYRLHFPDRKLRVIMVGGMKSSLVGPGISGDPREPRWDPDTGDLYQTMKDSVSSFQDSLRVVIFSQGESDVASGVVTPEEYQAALMSFGERVWDDLGVNVLVSPIRDVVIGQPVWYWDLGPFHWVQIFAVGESPYLHVGPQPGPLQLTTWDGVHYNEAEVLGRSFLQYLIWNGFLQ